MSQEADQPSGSESRTTPSNAPPSDTATTRSLVGPSTSRCTFAASPPNGAGSCNQYRANTGVTAGETGPSGGPATASRDATAGSEPCAGEREPSTPTRDEGPRWSTSCHSVKVEDPIQINVDVNLRVDERLQQFFEYENELRRRMIEQQDREAAGQAVPAPAPVKESN